MTRKRLLVVVALFAVAAAALAALTLPSNAAPIPVGGGPNCTIVLCPAPPPTCPPGQKAVIPAGQCCFKCLPT